jgi:hypothetical protein
MTPRDQLKERAKQLQRQGCSIDSALSNALKELDELRIQSNELLDLKHEIELEMEMEIE